MAGIPCQTGESSAGDRLRDTRNGPTASSATEDGGFLGRTPYTVCSINAAVRMDRDGQREMERMVTLHDADLRPTDGSDCAAANLIYRQPTASPRTSLRNLSKADFASPWSAVPEPRRDLSAQSARPASLHTA